MRKGWAALVAAVVAGVTTIPAQAADPTPAFGVLYENPTLVFMHKVRTTSLNFFDVAIYRLDAQDLSSGYRFLAVKRNSPYTPYVLVAESVDDAVVPPDAVEVTRDAGGVTLTVTATLPKTGTWNFGSRLSDCYVRDQIGGALIVPRATWLFEAECKYGFWPRGTLGGESFDSTYADWGAALMTGVTGYFVFVHA